MEPIAGLLLAAGASSRFGSDKLTHPLPSGEPMVACSARALADATDTCVALIRSGRPTLHTALADTGVTVHEVDGAEAGMGVTLAAGVRSTSQAGGWVIALGDMPAIHPGTLAAVVQALRDGASIVAPYHGGQRGHPVGFSRTWFEALTALAGDAGARDLLRTHSGHLTRIDVDDLGCVLDVDTPDDLRRLGR
ncbi:nucleotidyltransferase family protein [uncultured Aquabacterium sp.]|uniref:nucleotidyltransferase family protein n=1 Tax=uncultured Aquabacterium sp. TaxID=158753 RepID=UPI002639C748|nr:nucleotidyltransferase family protein [uncultured Aquabacterium sp.]